MEMLFDLSAQDYDDWYQKEPGKTIDRIQKQLVYKLLQPQAGERLLEIGCGTGNYLVELAQMGLDVSGIDISAKMLSRTRIKLERLGVKARLIQGDIHELDLTPNYFDAVLAVTSLEFLGNPRLVLAKAYNSLKPGGRLVVGIIAKSPWSEFYEQIARENPSSVYKGANFYSAEELLGFLPRGRRETAVGLYFPPEFIDFKPEKALDLEKNPPDKTRPGFVCAVWRKNND